MSAQVQLSLSLGAGYPCRAPSVAPVDARVFLDRGCALFRSESFLPMRMAQIFFLTQSARIHPTARSAGVSAERRAEAVCFAAPTLPFLCCRARRPFQNMFARTTVHDMICLERTGPRHRHTRVISSATGAFLRVRELLRLCCFSCALVVCTVYASDTVMCLRLPQIQSGLAARALQYNLSSTMRRQVRPDKHAYTRAHSHCQMQQRC